MSDQQKDIDRTVCTWLDSLSVVYGSSQYLHFFPERMSCLYVSLRGYLAGLFLGPVAIAAYTIPIHHSGFEAGFPGISFFFLPVPTAA